MRAGWSATPTASWTSWTRYQTRATFFVLGWVAERQPHLVRTIHARGHEVASHGYAHQRVYTQSPAQFRQETQRSLRLLEDLIGARIHGYRAASYSITRESLWALDILGEEGFTYDSSIFPIRHDRYGIPGYPRFCHRDRWAMGAGSSSNSRSPRCDWRVSTSPLPVAAIFDCFRMPLIAWGLRSINQRERQSALIYLHPWEIDPDQPRIPAGAVARFRQYVNLEKTEARLSRLLQDFRFGTVLDVLRHQQLVD